MKLIENSLENSRQYRKIHVAIPVLNESGNLPELMRCLEAQDVREMTAHFCVNQPDSWWDDPVRKPVCEDNAYSLDLLHSHTCMDLDIIDRSSPGKGWKGKHHGVGWARKTLLDAIDSIAGNDDIIVSLDADTEFDPGYLGSLLESLEIHTRAMAVSVPYYHRLTGDEETDRAILRYEIYMRYYAVNLWRIGSPYSFSALGSAMAFPVWAFRKVGGISPVKSGEDFYFLQKMVKSGPVLFWNREKVYPAARFSDRVYFGTGPAMIKGSRGDWSSYPVYDYRIFDRIKATMDLFPKLYEKDAETSMSPFLREIFGEQDPWESIRRNHRDRDKFIRACHGRVDGLRILQYLKKEQPDSGKTDEQCLADFIRAFYPEAESRLGIKPEELNFASMPLEKMDRIRDWLAEEEEKFQKSHFYSDGLNP